MSYQQLNPAKTTQLSLLRKGWWAPVYSLTDGANEYGCLSYKNISKRSATVVTSAGTITFNFEALFDRAILIADKKGVVIGKCTKNFFGRIRTLKLTSGFTADFYRPSFFSREYIWESPGYGKIMSLKSHFPFTLTTDVILYPTKTPAAIIPILIFLGQHLIILKRRKRAAH